MCSLVSCSEGVCARAGGEGAGGGGCRMWDRSRICIARPMAFTCRKTHASLRLVLLVPSLLLFSLSAPVALIQPLLLDGRLSHRPDPLLSCRTSPSLQSGSTCVHGTLGHQYYVCVNGRKRCALILRWPLLNPTHVIAYLYDGGIVGGWEGREGYSSVQ